VTAVHPQSETGRKNGRETHKLEMPRSGFTEGLLGIGQSGRNRKGELGGKKGCVRANRVETPILWQEGKMLKQRQGAAATVLKVSTAANAAQKHMAKKAKGERHF